MSTLFPLSSSLKPVQIFALAQVKAHLIFFSAFLPASGCSGYFNVTRSIYRGVAAVTYSYTEVTGSSGPRVQLWNQKHLK